MQNYEVEVKALLGNAKRADEIRRAMKKADASCALKSKNKQLNHYFEGGVLKALAKEIAPHLSKQGRTKLDDLTTRAKSFSVRTRNKDGDIYLVVKVSVDDTTSENGVARMEFEEKVPLTLEKLDELVLSSGFSYQAKWSREREEYVCHGVNVTLDKNAGYGWLAEFERIVDHQSLLEKARCDIRELMQALEVEELPQERLERMFAFYNAHWPEYYGTEKIFVVE
ncbi:CYTH domain-containing protein [Candidatus Kaiserbacteria bacterium]|nr:CYTH domain-containing protein [Candidatus Kaiserbacteria bacterium]